MLLKSSNLLLAIASAVKKYRNQIQICLASRPRQSLANSDLDCHSILTIITIEIGSHQLISHVNVTGTLTQFHFHELSFKHDEPLSA